MHIISREEYLAYKADWKREYKQLSAQIRAEKIATRLMSKGGYEAARYLQSIRAKDSNYAHYMMDELENTKEMARNSVSYMRWLDQQNRI